MGPTRSTRWCEPARPGAAALLACAALCAVPASAVAQTDVRVRVQENFRRDPNGVVLGQLPAGATVRALGVEGNWTSVELEGWVWLPSLQQSAEPGFDVVVSEAGGENLRAEPAGVVRARLEEGALLEELERQPSWARVRRTGWVWSASLDGSAGAAAGPMIQPEAPGAGGGGGAAPPEDVAPVGDAEAPILTSPDGDTLAVAAPRSELQVLSRSGNWVRVRLEGWMWMPEGSTPETGRQTPATLEPADLAAAPEAHVGRVVSWTLQFISLERAEAVRTDFYQGEPFLLARYGGEGGPFVYVPVPPERLAEVSGLVPLERIQITGRVRTGASALTGTPVVDLLSIERSREDP